MKRQRGIFYGLMAFLLLQLVSGLLLLPMMGLRAIFPFSQWELFSAPAKERAVILIYVTHWNGEELSPPAEGHQFFSQKGRSQNYIEAHDALVSEQQRISRSTGERLDPEVVKRVGQIFFKENETAEFELRESYLETLEFVRNQKVISAKSLGRYRYENGSLLVLSEDV